VKLEVDPHKMEDMDSMAIALQVHRGLLRYSPDGEVLPDLAERWETSDGDRTYRFTLKPARFSDGSLITALHVVHSFARIFHSRTGISADMNYVRGIEKFQRSGILSDLGVAAIGANIVEFHLQKPTFLFLKHLAVVDCAILATLDYRAPLTFSQGAATSGPYRILSASSERFELEKWREDPLDSGAPPLRLNFFTSAESALGLAKSGATDSLDFEQVTAHARDELLAQGWKESVTEVVKAWFIVMNPKAAPEPLRAYLFQAITPSFLEKIASGSRLRPAFGLVPFGMPGYIEAPLALGEKAFEVPVGKLRLTFSEGSPLVRQIAEELKKIWETKKLQIELQPLPRGEYLRKMFAAEGELILGTKGIDYFDGYSELTYFRSGNESNYFHVSDPGVDHAIDQIPFIEDSAKRVEEYRRLQKVLLKKLTYIPLFFGSQSSGLWSPRVKALPSHPIGLHGFPLETVEMSKP
jgi:ABC-type transport system substrate-binding protein